MQQKIRVRSLLLGVAFTLLFILILWRLYSIQIVEAAWLQQKAATMWGTERELSAKRGTIYDRHMQMLAGDARGYTVAVNPKVIHQFGLEQEVSKELAELLEKPQEELLEQVTRKNANGEYLVNVEVRREGWKIDSFVAESIIKWEKEFMKTHRIAGKDWPGVSLLEQQMRTYPKQNLAAHVIGYIDKDGKAWTGLEWSLDKWLRGTPGSVSYQRDGKRQKLPQSKPEMIQPTDGKDVVLTIDQTIQHYAETAIKKVYEQYKPKSMTAIVIDPQTMEVLALANAPTFNPNRYWEFDATTDFKNMAIQSRYEPGSTFKILTLTAAIDRGIFQPNELYLSGSIQVPGATIKDHRIGGWGTITYIEGLLRSSNVAFVKLGYEQLGEATLREYIDRFGFQSRTGIDLPGEIGSVISFRYPSEIATATYGQGGIIVTPIQQLVAYSAIANGGTLMKPYVVKQIIDSSTKEIIFEQQPTIIRQIVSKSVAQSISEYLELVVADQERGTGRRASIEGYRVAGKTGTANKVVDGKYSTDEWVVSFIGYAPVKQPRIAVAVIVDAPELGGNSNRTGEVAAPVFKEIVSQTLRYLEVPPDETLIRISSSSQQSDMQIPDLIDMKTADAIDELKARGFVPKTIGNGPRVLKQYPLPGEKALGSNHVHLLSVANQLVDVPNLQGESLRDVLQLCALLEWKCKIEGEGYVVSQQIEETPDGGMLKIHLQPMQPSAVSSTEGHQAEEVENEESTDLKSTEALTKSLIE
jgi:penicillin-binding protein 2B